MFWSFLNMVVSRLLVAAAFQTKRTMCVSIELPPGSASYWAAIEHSIN
jgi:hypothetical protein